MTDFKAKMHQIRFWLGLRPRPRCEELTALPQTGFWGCFVAGGGAGLEEGKGREGEVEGREREGRAPSYCWTRAPQSLATPLFLSRSGKIPYKSYWILITIWIRTKVEWFVAIKTLLKISNRIRRYILELSANSCTIAPIPQWYIGRCIKRWCAYDVCLTSDVCRVLRA